MAKTAKTKKAVPGKKATKAPAKKSAPVKAPSAKAVVMKKSSNGKPAKAAPLKIEKIREQLLLEQAKLKKRIGVIHDDDSTSDNSDVGDIADVAASHETREILRELQSTEEEQYKQIQAALKRIEAGTYGKCQRCGNAIEPARLEALPHAPTCIACKRKEERGEFPKS